MIDITLTKAKYRNTTRPAPRAFFALLKRDGIDPPGGTRVSKSGNHKSPGNRSGEKQKAKQGLGHRRRQGLGFTDWMAT